MPPTVPSEVEVTMEGLKFVLYRAFCFLLFYLNDSVVPEVPEALDIIIDS